MAETLDKELDNMEQVDEGNPVTKNAKPGEKMDTSKSGSPKKVVDVEGPVGASAEGAKDTKNAGASAAGAVKHEGSKSLSTKPSAASAKMEETEDGEQEEIAETKYDFTQDVDALVAGEELSEEFRERLQQSLKQQLLPKLNTKLQRCKKRLKLR